MDDPQKKILIIEDNKFLSDILMRKLRKEGFDSLLAIDGEDGLKRARKDKPDLIILDLVLPGIDGFEVLKRMKSDHELSSIPIIVLSNLGQQAEKEYALNLGADEFMVKADFNLNEIVWRIRQRLQKSKKRLTINNQ